LSGREAIRKTGNRGGICLGESSSASRDAAEELGVANWGIGAAIAAGDESAAWRGMAHMEVGGEEHLDGGELDGCGVCGGGVQ